MRLKLTYNISYSVISQVTKAYYKSLNGFEIKLYISFSLKSFNKVNKPYLVLFFGVCNASKSLTCDFPFNRLYCTKRKSFY